MTRAFNRTEEKTKRRMLRRNMPQPEALLWSRLRNKILQGIKFRRQYSIGKFVVDFYCPEAKLAIEIDGASHFSSDAEERDRERQAFIEAYGIAFLRFTNSEVCENIDGVLNIIEGALRTRLPIAKMLSG